MVRQKIEKRGVRSGQEGLMREVWIPFFCSQACEEVVICCGNPDDAAAVEKY